MTRFVLLLLLGSSMSVSAQTRIYAGVVGGITEALGSGYGVAGDVSAAVQHRRFLVDLHVASVEASRFRVSRQVGSGTVVDESVRVTFSAALDAGYVLPVYKAVGVVGGAGLRLLFDRERTIGLDRSYTEFPYVHAGILVGRPDRVRVYGRVEASMVGVSQLDWYPTRTQVGVLVPLNP